MRRKNLQIHRYEMGTNEYLDKIIEDTDTVWIVQGPVGRRPILANTKEEALDKYEGIERNGRVSVLVS